MKTFGTLLLVLVLHGTVLPQAASRFPHGMYIYEHHGIYLNGPAPAHYTDSRGENLLQFWHRVLGLNYFNISISSDRGTDERQVSAEKYFDDYLWTAKSYLGKTERSGYGLKDDLLNGKITLNFITNCLHVISDGQYLLFNPSSSENQLVFTKAPFAIDGSYTVSLPGTAETSSGARALIANIAVEGSAEVDGTNANRHIIRPLLNGNEKTHRAEFFVRFVIANSTMESTSLTVRINDSAPLYDSKNQHVLDTVITIPKGSGPFTFELPFSLLYQNDDGSTIGSAYAFGLNLNVDCAMKPGGSFQIRSVAFYDDRGKRAIENPRSIANYQNLDALLLRLSAETRGTGGKPKQLPILELTDESVIANFAPMHAAASYIRKSWPGRFRIYATNPEIQGFEIDKRFLRETALDLYGKDEYPVTPSFDYWRDIIGKAKSSSYFARLDSVRTHIAVYRPSTIPLSIIQLHGSGSQLHEPSGSFIRSMAYISILLNYKGISYWYSGPEVKRENQALYRSTDLANAHGSMKPNMSLYRYMFDSTNMVEDKKKAIQSISALLNSRYLDKSGKSGFIGDLLYGLKFGSQTVIGADGNAKRSFRSMGISSLAEVVKAEFVQPDKKETFAGIGYASANGEIYFFIPNLNEDGRASTLRLTFASAARGKNLRISTLTAPGKAAETIPRNGTLTVPIPRNGAVILAVQNVD